MNSKNVLQPFINSVDALNAQHYIIPALEQGFTLTTPKGSIAFTGEAAIAMMKTAQLQMEIAVEKTKNSHVYESYKTITATPMAHIAFLEVVVQEIKNPSSLKRLYERLADTISINGQPFSQAKHLQMLDNLSDDWDITEMSDDLKQRMIPLINHIKTVDAGYDIGGFIHGYDWMLRDLEERGVTIQSNDSVNSVNMDFEIV